MKIITFDGVELTPRRFKRSKVDTGVVHSFIGKHPLGVVAVTKVDGRWMCVFRGATIARATRASACASAGEKWFRSFWTTLAASEMHEATYVRELRSQCNELTRRAVVAEAPLKLPPTLGELRKRGVTLVSLENVDATVTLRSVVGLSSHRIVIGRELRTDARFLKPW